MPKKKNSEPLLVITDVERNNKKNTHFKIGQEWLTVKQVLPLAKKGKIKNVTASTTKKGKGGTEYIKTKGNKSKKDNLDNL